MEEGVTHPGVLDPVLVLIVQAAQQLLDVLEHGGCRGAGEVQEVGSAQLPGQEVRRVVWGPRGPPAAAQEHAIHCQGLTCHDVLGLLGLHRADVGGHLGADIAAAACSSALQAWSPVLLWPCCGDPWCTCTTNNGVQVGLGDCVRLLACARGRLPGANARRAALGCERVGKAAAGVCREPWRPSCMLSAAYVVPLPSRDAWCRSMFNVHVTR